MNDFELTRCDFTVNIDVGSQKDVVSYIRVLQNIGKVSGFEPKFDEEDYARGIHADRSFDLINANGIEFSIYNKWKQSDRAKAKNILRAEVRLFKQKAINKYTKKAKTADKIRDMAKQCESIFMKTFRRIVPAGDHYTMAQAEKRISDNVSHVAQREKMIKLLNLTRKNSLYESLKKLNDKNADRILSKFAKIDVSPILLKKQYNMKYLCSLYKFLK